MKVKRFLAPDIRQAMRMVRKQQGPDAVILSNRKVDGGIEMVIALDFDAELLSQTTLESSGAVRIKDGNGAIEENPKVLQAKPELATKQSGTKPTISENALEPRDFSYSLPTICGCVGQARVRWRRSPIRKFVVSGATIVPNPVSE